MSCMLRMYSMQITEMWIYIHYILPYFSDLWVPGIICRLDFLLNFLMHVEKKKEIDVQIASISILLLLV